MERRRRRRKREKWINRWNRGEGKVEKKGENALALLREGQ